MQVACSCHVSSFDTAFIQLTQLFIWQKKGQPDAGASSAYLPQQLLLQRICEPRRRVSLAYSMCTYYYSLSSWKKRAQEFLARIVCCASEDKQVQRDTPQILLPGWPGQQSSCSLSSRASFAAGDLVISSIIAPPGRRNHSAAAPTGARAAAESRAPMKRIARSRSCPVPNPRGGKK